MKLHLYEELLLLALRDEKGTVGCGGTWYKQAIGGALLSELMLEQRLGLAADGKHVELLSTTPMGDPLIDDCLSLVEASTKPRKLDHWFSKFSDRPKLLAKAAEALCAKGVLSEQKSKFLWIFNTRSYPELNHEPERLLIERLEQAIFGEATNLDPRTVTVISLAHKTGLLGMVFDKSELKRRKQHIEAIIAGERMGEVAKKVIEAITMAIMVSTIIVPVVIT